MPNPFRLELPLSAWQTTIAYPDPIVLLGSCFTENMYHKLAAYKFNVLQNPHGILFNPLSIARAVADYAACRRYTPSDLMYIDEAWHSWHHHTAYSSPDCDVVLHRINTHIEAAHHFLTLARWCFLTLGSAWVYELLPPHSPDKEQAQAVANCHRAPAEWFRRRLLSLSETTDALAQTIGLLRRLNPSIDIVLTVSPVRHLREGFVDNNRSKATLLLAAHDIAAQNEQTRYFPAYELVVDDLRDYRFYADDMVHPNYAATNYVWRRLSAVCFDRPTQQLMRQVEKVQNAYRHVPFNPQSAAHRRLLTDSYAATLQLQQQLPFLSWKDELQYFGVTI